MPLNPTIDTGDMFKNPNRTYTDWPASVTYTIQTKNGFNCLYTLRELTGQALLDKMEAVEADFAKRGIIPQPIKKFGGVSKEVEYVDGRKCPVDGGRLVKKVSKAGKPYHACENGRYDFATKQTHGCQFVDWLDK